MDKKDWKVLEYLNLGVSFGITMLVSVFFGYYAGQWLDKKLHTTPYLTLFGFMLGVVAAFRILVRDLLKETPKTRKNKEDENRQQ